VSARASRSAVVLATCAAAVAVAAVTVLSFGADHRVLLGSWPVWVGAALVAVLSLGARSHPRTAIVAASTTCAVVLAVSSHSGGVVPLTLACALTGAQAWPFVTAPAWRVPLLVATTAATTAGVLVATHDRSLTAALAAATWTVALGVATFLFTVPITRARQRQALLRQSLDRAASEIAVTSRRAVNDERVRIARDLHDSAGHLVTAITIHASIAQKTIHQAPETAAEAISTVEEYSRQAMLEIQSVLRVLDGAAPPVEEEPGLDRLDALVEEVAGLGLAVQVSEVGEEVPLTPAVSAVAYRLLREGLVNVRKHSAGREARVVVRWPEPGIRTGVIEVEVVDAGPPVGASTGSGIGLRSLRERVALEGGTVVVGRLSTGGFHVRARIPLGTDHPATPAASKETSWT